MGEMIKMVCRGCGQDWHCRTGCGVNHAGLESVIACFAEEAQKDILRQTEGDRFPLFSFGYRPAHCEKCYDIVSVPVIQLMKAGTEYIGECPKCLVTIKSEQLKEKLVCPICESREFDQCREGYWD